MDSLRIRMREGKQKELIDAARKSVGSWKGLSKTIGLSEDYLKSTVRNEKATISLRTYKILKLLAGNKSDEFIMELLSPDWGRKKGVLLSPRTKAKKVELVKPSVELAEIIGIMLGDGNLYENQYAVRVCGNATDDSEYSRKHVCGIFESVFGTTPKLYHFRAQNELILYIYSKTVAQNLVHYGLVYGNKKKKNVGIPEWITERDDYIRACVRGLFDTDGTVFVQRGKLKIELASGIPRLHESFLALMERMGFNKNWSRLNSHGVSRYGLYSMKDVRRFINEIGFNNMKHLKKCAGPGSVAA